MGARFDWALRRLARRPGFTAVVVATLALGIGAAVAIFSVVNAVLLRPLPFPHADRLLALHTVTPDGQPTGAIAPRDMPRLYANDSLDGAAIAFYAEGRIVGGDGTSYNMGRYGVTDQFFDVFDEPMALGRGFERGEPQGPVVISYAAWRDVFGEDPDIIGKPINVENGVRPVVGVAPEGFDFPGHAGYWTLMQLGPAYANLRGYQGYLRLKPGVARERFDAELAVLGPQLGADAATHKPIRFVTEPLLDFVVGDLGPTVLILFGATAILLFIACINVANLLLSHGTARTRELALRAAIGAQRGRIFRGLLAESTLLSVAGGLLGVLAGVLSIRVMLGLAPPDLPRLDAVPIDGRVLLFALAATLVTVLLSGVVPAWRLSRSDLRTLVNDGGRGASAGRHQQRVFAGLVVAEIGLAVLLVIGAGLLVRSYYKLVTTDPGFRSDRMLSVYINVPNDAIRIVSMLPPGPDGKPRYAVSYAPIADFFRSLEERVRALPGVESVGVSSSVPLSSEQWDAAAAFTVEGRAAPDPSVAQTQATQRSVSPSFFSAMGVRILAGRPLQPEDRRGAPGAAVVNQAFARRFFPGEDPVGRILKFPDNFYSADQPGIQYGERVIEQAEIVGVADDVRYASLSQPAEPSIYLSDEQFALRRTNLVVRAAGDPADLIAAIRGQIAAIKPMPAEFELFSQIFRVSLARQRLGMSLLTAFGAVALALAAIGVYGLMAYSVAQRTGEIAVRAALGASEGRVLALVLRRGARLALIGVVMGMVVAAAARRLVESQLYGVGALDWPVFAGVPAALFAVALLATLVPARRAARIDPAVMLRTE
jgi:putative ABC transport system permease protein